MFEIIDQPLQDGAVIKVIGIGGCGGNAVEHMIARVYGKSASERAAEIGYHLYQAGTAADPVRTATFLGQAAKNALAVGAFEEVRRLVDIELGLLPGDSMRERAEALSMRGEAFWGLGRIDDAKAAWKGAAQRYEELGDPKAASTLHSRIGHLESHHRETGADAPVPVRVAPVEAGEPA